MSIVFFLLSTSMSWIVAGPVEWAVVLCAGSYSCAHSYVSNHSIVLSSQTNFPEMMNRYKQLLTYIRSAVTRNYSEKSINSILDYISTSKQVRLEFFLSMLSMCYFVLCTTVEWFCGFGVLLMWWLLFFLRWSPVAQTSLLTSCVIRGTTGLLDLSFLPPKCW